MINHSLLLINLNAIFTRLTAPEKSKTCSSSVSCYLCSLLAQPSHASNLIPPFFEVMCSFCCPSPFLSPCFLFSCLLFSPPPSEAADPALSDPSLLRKLRSNREVALSHLEEVITKYALKQEDTEEQERIKRLEKNSKEKEVWERLGTRVGLQTSSAVSVLHAFALCSVAF